MCKNGGDLCALDVCKSNFWLCVSSFGSDESDVFHNYSLPADLSVMKDDHQYIFPAAQCKHT